jgi:eukaryotic-like serine/threonine-protein kinase
MRRTSSPERFRQIDEIFDAALDRAPNERDAYVARACGDDVHLRAEVRALLQAYGRSGDFLESPAVQLGAPLLDEPTTFGLSPSAPERVGPFRLVRELGHGGMGVVYLGEREGAQFEQRVALKLIRHAGRGEGVIRRFVEERRILARLEHPGIARLVDGGVTEHGLPYFAMELVEGEPIDSYCASRSLTVGQRLGVFAAVCEAVQYAHEHLVIHRDIKPSNILVTPDGTVKLLDFGIAKLLEGAGGEARAALTADGGGALTPDYAAPEQVRGEAITTATDVYTLGVLLYLLLSGRHPTAGGSHTPAETIRGVLEVEPARLGLGDLDTVLAKALRKAPGERYPTVAAFADDLRRYLRQEPVSARPDSLAYRARKFVARHRGGVAAAALAVALLAGGALRERTLRAHAEAEARRAGAVEQYLVSVFDVADPFAPPNVRGGDVTARALLDRGAVRVDSVLADQPDVQAELRRALGHVYANLGLYDKAAPLLQRSLAQRRVRYGPRHPAVAESMDRLGEVLTMQRRFDEAEPLLRGALAQRRALLGNADTATAASLDHLATMLWERSDFAAAEPLFREALALRRGIHGPDHEAIAYTLNNLGVLFFSRGRYDEAEPLYREALAIQRRRLGEEHPRTAQTLQNLAQVQQLRGHLDEADSLYRRALAAKRKTLGNAHPSVTVNLNNLGYMLARERGKPDEAEPLIREALALDRQIFGEQHDYVAASLNNLGTVLRLKGEFDEAEATLRQALDINRAIHKTEHVGIAQTLNNLATVLHLKGDADAAIPLFRQSLGQYGRLVGERHRNYVNVSINLGKALRERGQALEAESLFRATVSRGDPANLGQRAQFIAAQIGLGQALTDQGRAAEALPVLERALEMARAQYGADDWRTAEARLALGAAWAATGEYGRAEPILVAARAALETQKRGQPGLVRQATVALERVHRALGRPEAARRYRAARGPGAR